MQDITGWGENDRGVSYTFGGDVVKEVLRKFDCSLITRAHQVPVLQLILQFDNKGSPGALYSKQTSLSGLQLHNKPSPGVSMQTPLPRLQSDN